MPRWAFRNDPSFYAILGTLALLPLSALVAAFRQQSYRTGLGDVRQFLIQIAAVAGDQFWKTAFKTAGLVSGVIVLLALTAYTSNRVGDSLLPLASQPVKYFGNPRVRWTTEYSRDWEHLVFEFRTISGIGGDRAKWDKAKADMGKYDSRFFRTLTIFAALWTLSSIIDLVLPRWRRRGAIGLVVSLAAVLMFEWLWVEREAKFIENLVASYQGEYLRANSKPPQLPDSYNTVVGTAR